MEFKFFVRKLFVLLVLLFLFTSCKKTYPPTDMTKIGIIPKPVSMVATNGTFVLEEDAAIYVDADDKDLMKNAEILSSLLASATGYDLEIIETEREPSDGNIFLTTGMKVDTTLEAEGYELLITEDIVKISSRGDAGVLYGIQTLRQIFPAKIEQENTHEEVWHLPTGNIRDWPHYAHRGAMLDVARHFFDVATVKKFVDYLAMYKMNVLHLHLSDDQGWRIEIESWPNLTTHGGSTQVGGGEGGFFTKNDYKEIVQYAANRHITVIPEIDMPGHTNAALASYPELNCDNKAPELYTGTKVGFSTLCTDKDVVYEFVDDVVREISEITPGPWFHVGGDESHATETDDYIKFINRVREIVHSHGKTMIGWDEVAMGDVDESDIVQFWLKKENARMATKKGAKVIMSPSTNAYLDMKYDSSTVMGVDWAGYTEVDEAYNWDPATFVTGVEKLDILGIEAPLWSETIENLDDIEYLMFPRIVGHAEIGWTAPENRRWDEYKQRLGQQKERFEVMGIDYYRSSLVPWQDEPGFLMNIETSNDTIE